MVEQLIKNKRIEELLIRNNVAMLGLFSSYSREEETDTIDLDLLIKFSTLTFLTLFTIIGIVSMCLQGQF